MKLNGCLAFLFVCFELTLLSLLDTFTQCISLLNVNVYLSACPRKLATSPSSR